MAATDQISRRVAAAILDVHVDTVSKLLPEGLEVAVIGRRGRGNALVFSRRAVESWAAGRAGRSGPLDPKQQRARRDAAQAALSEHKLGVEERKYLLREDVEKGWSLLTGAVRSHLLSLPQFMTSQVCRDYQLAGEAGVYAALRKGASVEDLRALAVSQGMTTIAADGIRRAAAGETSLGEVIRVLGLR